LKNFSPNRQFAVAGRQPPTLYTTFCHYTLQRAIALPVFRVRKEPFNWILTGKKTVELRRGKIKRGDYAVFLTGRSQPLKVKITRKQEGTIEELINISTFRSIVPTAPNPDGAIEYIRKIYSSLEGTFAAYEIETPEDRSRWGSSVSKKTDK
jgi:ASC-1-like (ASCH) protein